MSFISDIKDKVTKKIALYPEYTDEEIDSILDEATLSDMFEYKPVSDTMQIAFVVIGSNGAYFFMQSKTTDEKEILIDIGRAKNLYCLPPKGIFFFIRTEEFDVFSTGNELYKIEDVAKRFVALYENNLRPLIDLNYINFKNDYEKLFEPNLPDEYTDENGDPIEVDDTGDVSYVAPLLSKTTIETINEKIKKAFVQEGDVNIRYDEYGQKYKKGSAKTKVFGYSYKEEWYPVASDDPETFLLKTVLGGWFGLHKFATGEFMQGILYLITCGGCCIFYLFDVIMIILGNYSISRTEYIEDGAYHKKIKTKIYLDKINNLKFSAIMCILSIAIAFISTKIIFVNVLSLINGGFFEITTAISNTVS